MGGKISVRAENELFRHANQQTDRQIEWLGHTNQQTDRQTNTFEQTNEQIDRQRARQVELGNYQMNIDELISVCLYRSCNLES